MIMMMCTCCVQENLAGDNDVLYIQISYFTAALIASSASIEQWSFTGGRLKCLAISVFLILIASSISIPLTHSVARELLAIADPHPNVLKTASWILPSSPTLIWSFITSPQAGAPTRPAQSSNTSNKQEVCQVLWEFLRILSCLASDKHENHSSQSTQGGRWTAALAHAHLLTWRAAADLVRGRCIALLHAQ